MIRVNYFVYKNVCVCGTDTPIMPCAQKLIY
jgi:hypothetical protein